MEATDALSDALTLPPRVAVDGHRRRSERLERRLAAVRDRGRGVLGPLALSWGLAAVLIVELVKAGGFWQVAANTRILDVLVRTGVVPLTDTNIGLVGTMPDVRYYVESNDYIDFVVALAAVGVMVAVWWLKSLQFHQLARFCGIGGRRYSAHARAYFYGHGIGRTFPFGMGSVASAAVLEGQGAPRGKAAQTTYLANLFVAFEIVVFALYAMAAMGYTRWLGELAFPLAILALSYFVVRPVRGHTGPLTLRGRLRLAYLAFRSLDARRSLLIKLAVMSAVSFLGS